jgi:TolB protein
MKKLYFILLVVTINVVLAQQPSPLGPFDAQMDIGHPKITGSGKYDPVTHSFDIKGSGYNIWFARDEFHFVYKRIKGDFTATANFDFTGTTGNAHRKIGWMLRESTDEKSMSINAVEHGDGLTVLQWRSANGDAMKDPDDEIFYPEKTFETVQLQRIGKKLIMRVGRIGEALQTVGAHDMPNMPDDALLGIFICSHDPAVTEEARVWDVHLDQPALAAK